MPSDTTRRKRQLGRFMESIRKRHEPAMLPEALADAVETSRATISRMENGLQVPNKHLFIAILGALGANTEERFEALLLWTHAKQSTVRIEHATDFPPEYVAFRRDETQALAELTIDYTTLPGLLQTADYARAVADASRLLGGHDSAWSERAGEERAARQRLLLREDPLRLHALVSEAALHLRVGGPAVMAEQFEHLLAMVELENVTFQVVPFRAGAFGPMNGPLVILEFDHDAENPYSVYLEYPTGGKTVEREPDVSSFTTLFGAVRELAVSEEETVRLVRAELEKTGS